MSTVMRHAGVIQRAMIFFPGIGSVTEMDRGVCVRVRAQGEISRMRGLRRTAEHKGIVRV